MHQVQFDVRSTGDLLRHSACWLADHGFHVDEAKPSITIENGFSATESQSVDLSASPPVSALDFEALAQAIERSESIRAICLGSQCKLSDAVLHRLSRAVTFSAGCLEEFVIDESCLCDHVNAHARLEALLARNIMRARIKTSLLRVGDELDEAFHRANSALDANSATNKSCHHCCDLSVGGELGVHKDAAQHAARLLAGAWQHLTRPQQVAPHRAAPPLLLVELNLSGHTVGDDGASIIAECCMRRLSGTAGTAGCVPQEHTAQTAAVVRVAGADAARVCARPRVCPLVRILRLRNSGIADLGCIAIAKAIECDGVMPGDTMATGSSSDNDGSSGNGSAEVGEGVGDGDAALSRSSEAALHELDLSANMIGDAGAHALADAIALTSGGGGNRGSGSASSGSSSNPHGAVGLRVLRLGQNIIGTGGTESLLDAADRRARTRTLWRGRGCISWHPPQLLLSMEQQQEASIAGSAPEWRGLRVCAAGGAPVSSGANRGRASVSATTPTTATIVPQHCIVGDAFYHEHTCDESVNVHPPRLIFAQTQPTHVGNIINEECEGTDADAGGAIGLHRASRPRPRSEMQLQAESVSVAEKAPPKRASFRERHSKIEEKKDRLQEMRKAHHKAGTVQPSETIDRAQLLKDMVKLQLQQLKASGAFISSPTDT